MPNTERRSRIRTNAGGGHRAANRVVDILELLATSADGLALRDLSRQLETPKSSLLPLLRALTARDYLTQGRAGEYGLGPGVLDLGAAAPAHRKLVDIARPAVVDLGRRTGETVFLGVLSSDRNSVVYLDKVESDHVIRYAGGVGDRRPLHATSSGKAILAFLSREEREEILRSLSLARHTERTVTSLPALRASLDEIRRSGVSVTVDELMPGASGIAAAIFDRHARVVGACAIGGPTARVRPRLRSLAAEVSAAARAVSARLGHVQAAPSASMEASLRNGGRTRPVAAGCDPPSDESDGRDHESLRGQRDDQTVPRAVRGSSRAREHRTAGDAGRRPAL